MKLRKPLIPEVSLEGDFSIKEQANQMKEIFTVQSNAK